MAQRRYVRDVMLTVPGVRRQCIVQSHGAALGMLEASRKILGLHAAQERDPSLMQGAEQSHRDFDGRFLRII